MGFALLSRHARCLNMLPAAAAAGEVLKHVDGQLEFQDVTFAYPSRPGAGAAARMQERGGGQQASKLFSFLCSQRQHAAP